MSTHIIAAGSQPALLQLPGMCTFAIPEEEDGLHGVFKQFLVCVTAGSSIRLKGRNLTECEHIKLGAYHTLELEPQRAFSLAKACWDSLDIERLRSACDPQASADLAALLITVSTGFGDAVR
jgi:hypothetical protein